MILKKEKRVILGGGREQDGDVGRNPFHVHLRLCLENSQCFSIAGIWDLCEDVDKAL